MWLGQPYQTGPNYALWPSSHRKSRNWPGFVQHWHRHLETLRKPTRFGSGYFPGILGGELVRWRLAKAAQATLGQGATILHLKACHLLLVVKLQVRVNFVDRFIDLLQLRGVHICTEADFLINDPAAKVNSDLELGFLIARKSQ